MDSNEDRLLTERQVRDLLGGVSSMTIWRWLARGLLPNPIKISTRNYWRTSEINAFIAAQPRRSTEGTQAA